MMLDYGNIQERHIIVNKINIAMRKLIYNFELISLTTLYILICLTFYILLEIYSNVKEVSYYCALYWAGAATPLPIRENGEWYRLIFPIFLHANFAHIAFNIIALLMFGYQVEYILKWYKYASLCIFSGIIGNITGAAFMGNSILVGASTSIMGIVGFHFVHLIVQYNDSSQAEEMRKKASRLMIYYFILISSSLLDTSGNNGVYAHMGGLLLGVTLALIFYSHTFSKKYSNQ